MRRLTASVCVACLTAVCAVSAPAGAQVGSTTCAGANDLPANTTPTALAETMRCMINAERTAIGENALGTASPLTTAANRQLNDVLKNSFLGHVGSDGSTIVSRTKDSGFLNKKLKKWTVGEILAYGQESSGTPTSIITAWMNSPTHERVITHATFKSVAVAVARGTTAPNGATDTSAATYEAVFGFKKNK
jgi:uncharacterized protein YkwD